MTIHQTAIVSDSAQLGTAVQVGPYAVIESNVALGDVSVEDHIFLSNNVGAHQFVRMGRYAMVGGKSKIVQDVLPFITTSFADPTEGLQGRAGSWRASLRTAAAIRRPV